MLLSDEEILSAVRGFYGTPEGAFMGSLDDIQTARAIEAAILAKLASAELPNTEYAYAFGGSDLERRFSENVNQAHAQGFAAGAAAQLAEKPSGYLSQHNLEMLQQGYPQTIVMIEGAKRDTPLYTRREAK